MEVVQNTAGQDRASGLPHLRRLDRGSERCGHLRYRAYGLPDRPKRHRILKGGNRVVYTTNVIESHNFSLRKIIKGGSAFPNDDSVYRLIYLGLEQISRKWTMPIKNWKAALQQFAILYEDRLPLEALGITKAQS